MAKKKILGIEFDALPTVAENAEKMTRARDELHNARTKMLGTIHANKLNLISEMKSNVKAISDGKKKDELKNVTPNVIDVTHHKVDGILKRIEGKKEEMK